MVTTLFLVLINQYIKSGKQKQFTNSYFAQNKPKIDYKVRENSHNFLINFINHLLKGGDVKDVEDQYWFYSEYKNDATIWSLYNNYLFIAEKLASCELSIEYLERQIEFWYFDTNESEQGEELYLYMNSRGETVQNNENIKAELLEEKSDHEKHVWGSKWEIWQALFWKNKGENKNADKRV
ncbi:MAG: hypothetical protein IPH20_14455 [Bacteroidales bacterium]|nr:hypothetical protein [Bacteroidales bacterium]